MTRSLRLVLAYVAVSSWLALSGCQTSNSESATSGANGEKAKSTAAEDQAVESKPANGREVLQRMVTAYQKATNYVDWGTIHLTADLKGSEKPMQLKADFSVMLARPNKLHVQANQGGIVCDGQKWHAYVRTLPGQMVIREAPASLSLRLLDADPVLGQALIEGFEGRIPDLTLHLPQLVLLLGGDPLNMLTADAEEVLLVEPGKIDDQDCYRVQARWPQEGTATFWIDQKTYALRRMLFPTARLWQKLGGPGQVQSVSLVAEFTGAKLNGDIDAKAFQIDVPQDTKQVKLFTPASPYQLIGKKVPDFKFLDMQGKAVTPESLAGKTVVLDFWATTCEPRRDLESVYQKYKDNDKVALYIVSVDPKEVENKALEDAFKAAKITLPVLRDPEQYAGKALQLAGVPTMMLIGPDGVLQHCEVGENPNLAAVVPERIEKLLAGKDVTKEALGDFQEQKKQAESFLDAAFQGKLPEDAKTAAKSQPKSLKLISLWKCAELRSTGNILVVSQPNGPPRLFVIDKSETIAEVNPADGKVIANHQPQLEPKEAQPDPKAPQRRPREWICRLRTGVGRDGQRVYAGFAPGNQRVYFFDQNWKLFSSFPENALKNPHPGIADVQLGDLDGDGTLKAYVGYYGVVGVQGASLEGKRLWSNRALVNIMQMALTDANPKGQRDLVCTNESGSLSVLDPKGSLRTNIPVKDRLLEVILAADLKGDGQAMWCGLGVRPLAEPIAMGLDLKGQELWSYPLPKGRQSQPVEPIVAARITSGGPGNWIIPGSDGSVHILSADGKLIEQFNYGAPLCGLATIEVDGKPVLLVSSEGNGLEAWRVEP
jgi:thiol-disulfide isomerase/thioredoxin